ncbi:hypothetical protein J6590_101898 [Homalodisca vitripennis]|nr:hypothetical protein J6590_101898 [Homalodisca vitripennis]
MDFFVGIVDSLAQPEQEPPAAPGPGGDVGDNHSIAHLTGNTLRQCTVCEGRRFSCPSYDTDIPDVDDSSEVNDDEDDGIQRNGNLGRDISSNNLHNILRNVIPKNNTKEVGLTENDNVVDQVFVMPIDCKGKCSQGKRSEEKREQSLVEKKDLQAIDSPYNNSKCEKNLI